MASRAPRYTVTQDGKTVRLNRQESRMVARGIRAGFRHGRYHGTACERLYPADACPYDGGRPKELWELGHEHGARQGVAERIQVAVSYRRGLGALEAGAPASWA